MEKLGFFFSFKGLVVLCGFTGVLLDTPLPCGAEGLMPMRNAKVAVFNISLVPCYHKGALTSVQCNVVKECPDLHAIEVTEGKGIYPIKCTSKCASVLEIHLFMSHLILFNRK